MAKTCTKYDHPIPFDDMWCTASRWIGREAVLLPGAELGNGVIVGARAVVRGKIPDYSVVSGNPATVMKMRYGEAQVRKLVDLAWWNWPDENIENAKTAIEARDIEKLERLRP